uniref:Trehalose 6-phosphate phosphatase n=1 Tax=Rhizophora mucronata TaxID=61149 RepID=A0A2P2JAA3_RHIMU
MRISLHPANKWPEHHQALQSFFWEYLAIDAMKKLLVLVGMVTYCRPASIDQ